MSHDESAGLLQHLCNLTSDQSWSQKKICWENISCQRSDIKIISVLFQRPSFLSPHVHDEPLSAETFMMNSFFP